MAKRPFRKRKNFVRRTGKRRTFTKSRKFTSGVQRVVSKNIETKYANGTYHLDVIPSGVPADYTIRPFTMVQGVERSRRIGDKIFVKMLTTTYYVSIDPTTSTVQGASLIGSWIKSPKAVDSSRTYTYLTSTAWTQLAFGPPDLERVKVVKARKFTRGYDLETGPVPINKFTMTVKFPGKGLLVQYESDIDTLCRGNEYFLNFRNTGGVPPVGGGSQAVPFVVIGYWRIFYKDA